MDPLDYASFLEEIMKAITMIDSNGRRVMKPLEEITYSATLEEMQLKGMDEDEVDDDDDDDDDDQDNEGVTNGVVQSKVTLTDLITPKIVKPPLALASHKLETDALSGWDERSQDHLGSSRVNRSGSGTKNNLGGAVEKSSRKVASDAASSNSRYLCAGVVVRIWLVVGYPTDGTFHDVVSFCV